MTSPEHFDYLKAAQEAGISDDQLRHIERMFRKDYPKDNMLYELHVLRACHAIRDGMTTVEALLREDGRNGEASAA